MGEQERLIGVVGREHHADAARGEPVHLAQHADLIAEVQARGGLIHDEHAGLLREGARDERELALAPADLAVRTVGEMADAEQVQAAAAAARSAREGTEKAPTCAVRPMSTISSTEKGKPVYWAWGT